MAEWEHNQEGDEPPEQGRPMSRKAQAKMREIVGGKLLAFLDEWGRHLETLEFEEGQEYEMQLDIGFGADEITMLLALKDPPA